MGNYCPKIALLCELLYSKNRGMEEVYNYTNNARSV